MHHRATITLMWRSDLVNHDYTLALSLNVRHIFVQRMLVCVELCVELFCFTRWTKLIGLFSMFNLIIHCTLFGVSIDPWLKWYALCVFWFTVLWCRDVTSGSLLQVMVRHLFGTKILIKLNPVYCETNLWVILLKFQSKYNIFDQKMNLNISSAKCCQYSQYDTTHLLIVSFALTNTYVTFFSCDNG